MQVIDCGASGTAPPPAEQKWDSLLSRQWAEVARILSGKIAGRPVQIKALGEQKVLESRRNLIVSAPTNAGKSLVGDMVLLEAVRQGGRVVLLEPLRALARERAEELQSLQAKLGAVLGRDLQVAITTGDYRLTDERLFDPPPDSGQIVVATPERFDVILRIPEFREWVNSIAAVCVDEAHLISSPRRGPILEYLITSLLCQPRPPRLVLLSATLGRVEEAQEWLKPCDVVAVRQRSPLLHKSVASLDDGENIDTAIANIVSSALYIADNAILIFVYQTRSAERLAQILSERLAGQAGSVGPLAYHAQMNASQREAVRRTFLDGNCRCVVTTTALGMGVNLPATHVIIRDVTFPGEGRLPVTDLLQMMGRAGRGDRVGHAVAVLRHNDPWNAAELAQQIRDEPLPELRSSFATSIENRGRIDKSLDLGGVAGLIAAQLARNDGGLTEGALRTFFGCSLGGKELVASIASGIAWLADPSRLLAYRNEQGYYQATALGFAANRSTLPISIAAGVGQLIRDLLQCDAADTWLMNWAPLDHLILLECLAERPPNLRRFSRALVDKVDSWMEAQSRDHSVVYREWVRGEPGACKADQLLGSLGIVLTPDAARQHAYSATFRSIVLFERGRGIAIDDIERRWSVSNLSGIEEQWRDRHLWLLNALSRILETRCYYYCLKEHCDASLERVRRLSRILQRMRLQLFGLQEHLKYCSPLGGVLRSMQRAKAGRIGPATIRRLESAGITTLSALASLSIDQMIALGIRRNTAAAIRSYLRRRAQ